MTTVEPYASEVRDLSAAIVSHKAIPRFRGYMRGHERHTCLDIRYGRVSADDALARAFDLDARLDELEHTSVLPPEPRYAEIESWMHSAYMRAWRTAFV